MKVLLVSNQRQNDKGIGNPIMYRMRDALHQDERIDNVTFLPFCNSLISLHTIRSTAKKFDVVHIHFGGLYALIIWCALIGIQTKKIITFHGTDIHAKALNTAKGWKERTKIKLNQKASLLSIHLFDSCGFVATEMLNYVPKRLTSKFKRKFFLNSLGVNYSEFQLMDKNNSKKYLEINLDKRYVLFSDVSNTHIKRRDIAEAIVNYMGRNYSLLIMCGVKPSYVPYYINACEFLLLTSDEEGSPNIIREALSLNKPVFSVNVGDSVKQLKGLRNSAIISRDPQKAANTIASILEKPYTDNSRDNLQYRLDFVKVNREVVDQYHKL